MTKDAEELRGLVEEESLHQGKKNEGIKPKTKEQKKEQRTRKTANKKRILSDASMANKHIRVALKRLYDSSNA